MNPLTLLAPLCVLAHAFLTLSFPGAMGLFLIKHLTGRPGNKHRAVVHRVNKWKQFSDSASCPPCEQNQRGHPPRSLDWMAPGDIGFLPGQSQRGPGATGCRYPEWCTVGFLWLGQSAVSSLGEQKLEGPPRHVGWPEG